MRKILLAVVALSLLAGSTAQAFPFKKKKKKAKSVALYLLGSAAVTVGMAAVMPKGMGKVGQKIYTESLKKQGDDDWTQEILNRRQAEAEAEEEKKNG